MGLSDQQTDVIRGTSEIASPPPPIVNENAIKTIIPKKYSITTITKSIDSYDFESKSYTEKLNDSLEFPDIIQDADAQSAPADSIEIKRWRSNHGGTQYIDGEGNIFSHSNSYKISRIDITDNTQTVWTLPEELDIDNYVNNIEHNTSPSSYFYFIANGNMTRLDHTTDVFTQWKLPTETEQMMSSSDGIYIRPDNNDFYIINSQGNLNSTQIEKQGDTLYVYVEGASHDLKSSLTLPSGEIITKGGYSGSDGIDIIRFNDVFFDDVQINSDEAGDYVVTVQDMFQTSSTTFTLEEQDAYQVVVGSDPQEFDTSVVFLYKLDPEANTITLFSSDLSNPDTYRSYRDLVATDPDGSLYFIQRGYYANVYPYEFTHDIIKFDPNTSELISWANIQSNGISNIAVSDEKIYWTYYAGRQTVKIVELEIDTGMIKEVAMPYECSYVYSIVVDDSDTLFFVGCGYNQFYKFVPSTETFTQFYVGYPNNLEKLHRIDSTGTIYWSSGYSAGTIRIQDPGLPEIGIECEDIYDLDIQLKFLSCNVEFRTSNTNQLLEMGGFTKDDISVLGTANPNPVTNFQTDDTHTTFDVPFSNSGTVIIYIENNVATDYAGQGNMEYNRTYNVEKLPLEMELDYSINTYSQLIEYDVAFNTDVRGITEDDISVSGTANPQINEFRFNYPNNDAYYDLGWTQDGDVTVQVNIDAELNPNSFPNPHTFTIDTTPPTISSIVTNGTGSEIIITASEPLRDRSLGIVVFRDSGRIDITSHMINENKITLELSERIQTGETIIISYNSGIVDLARNGLESFVREVENNVDSTTAEQSSTEVEPVEADTAEQSSTEVEPVEADTAEQSSTEVEPVEADTAEQSSTEVEPVEADTAEQSSTEVEPVEADTAEQSSTEVEPVEADTAEQSSTEVEPVEADTAEQSSTEVEPVEADTAEQSSTEVEPVEADTAEQSSTEVEPVEADTAEQSSTEVEPVEADTAEQSSTEVEPVEADTAEQSSTEVEPVEADTAEQSSTEVEPVELEPTSDETVSDPEETEPIPEEQSNTESTLDEDSVPAPVEEAQ